MDIHRVNPGCDRKPLHQGGFFWASLFLLGALACLHAQNEESAFGPPANIQTILEKEQTRTLADLLAMSPEELAKVDIAEMQFLSLQDPTPPTKDLTTLFQLVDVITVAAKKHVEGKSGNPGQQAIYLIDALKKADIPGLPYPILYVSVGRRLGYPLRFAVDQKGGGISVRWETPTESYPVDLSERQIERIGELPPPVPAKEQAFYFLSPTDEFAYFLGTRGQLLEQHGKPDEALIAYTHALLLSPACRNYVASIRSVAPKLTPFYGHVSSKPAPDYSQRPDEVAEMNKAAMAMSSLATAEAKEISDASRQYRNDPAARTKAMNAIRIKYAQQRSKAQIEQNNRLVQEELQRRAEKSRQGY